MRNPERSTGDVPNAELLAPDARATEFAEQVNQSLLEFKEGWLYTHRPHLAHTAPVDLETSSGKVGLLIFAALASLDLERALERQNPTMEAAIARVPISLTHELRKDLALQHALLPVGQRLFAAPAGIEEHELGILDRFGDLAARVSRSPMGGSVLAD